MKKKSNRRIVREKCLQVLYAFQLGGDSLTNLTQSMIVDIKNQNDRNFAEQLINFVVANQKELEERIKERVSNWELDRIAVLDKILIKMKIHLIAIGGSAMHNLALALHHKGFEISGSDDAIFSPSKERLDKHGLLPTEIGWFTNKI